MPELTIERELPLPLASAYAAWTDPGLMTRWFAPGNMSCQAQADLRVGGDYRIAMHDPDTDEDHIVVGQYTAIEPNRLLAFSWRWHTSEVTTQVEVGFAAAGDGTRIKIRHRDFPEQEMCDKHSTGWNGCLSNLASRIDQLIAAA